MKKYYLKKGNREVKLGDKIRMETPVDTSYGKGVATVDVEVTKITLKKLIEDGFVIVKDSSENEKKADNEFLEAVKKLKKSGKGIIVATADEEDDLDDVVDSIVSILFDDEEQED